MALVMRTHATSLTATVNKPAGTVDGDLVFIACYKQSTGASSLSGWTQVYTRDLTNSNITVLTKKASGEGASWTVTGPSCCIANAVKGARLPSPWNQVNAASGATGTLAKQQRESFLMDVFTCWNTAGAAPAHSTPTNYTARGSVTESHGGGNMRMSVFFRETALNPGNTSVTNTTTSLVNSAGLVEVHPIVPGFVAFF